MSNFYSGALRATAHEAIINVGDKQAMIQSHITIRNTSARRVSEKIAATRPGMREIATRKVATAFSARSDTVTPIDIKLPVQKSTKPVFAAREKRVLDIDYVSPVLGKTTKSLSYMPSIEINQRGVHQKFAKYKVVFKLPSNAQRLIYSSLPLKSRKTRDGITCTYDAENVYALPIYVKWTELDVNVGITKRAVLTRLGGSRVVKVTLSVRNNSGRRLNNLVVEDSYSPGQAKPLRATQDLAIRFSSTKNFQRLIYKKKISLQNRELKKLEYMLVPLSTELTFTSAGVNYDGVLVAVSNVPRPMHFAPPITPSVTAFALPSGFSFDFTSKDHHLNEHGMWVGGQIYDARTSTLSWSTGAIFADKNFDDPYKWFTSHQVFRFKKAHVYHGASGWLPKSGGVSAVPGSYSNPRLKNFSNAIVLIRGWRFDFTSTDHHINRMRIDLSNIRFNKATGTVTWKSNVEYEDKNADDGYQYHYWYTVLGFNGKYIVRSFNGVDAGGTASHNVGRLEGGLKNFTNGMVVPLGWTFDFSSNDHHIDQNEFKLTNVKYNKANGRFDWIAHLNYSDKNRDDKYTWRYDVALIATHDGECRQYDRGPYKDDGGAASKSHSVVLNQLFKPITWENEKRDGDETGIDCGGSSPARDFKPVKTSVNPGTAKDANLLSLSPPTTLNFVRAHAEFATVEYALHKGKDPNDYYKDGDPHTPDRLVEAVAWYVANHMVYVADGGSWKGSQSAAKTLGETAHRGTGDFHGDCEDHAILRAALLRSLGFGPRCIYCADHHNSVDQGQDQECYGDKKSSGGHTYNVVIWKGKYRLLDYGEMDHKFWANKGCWNQHVTDNIWNDHTGEHWSKNDISPFGTTPLVNYPGNPSSPSPTWNWRTYCKDITP